jgi:hypothetical protein
MYMTAAEAALQPTAHLGSIALPRLSSTKLLIQLSGEGLDVVALVGLSLFVTPTWDMYM